MVIECYRIEDKWYGKKYKQAYKKAQRLESKLKGRVTADFTIQEKRIEAKLRTLRITQDAILNYKQHQLFEKEDHLTSFVFCQKEIFVDGILKSYRGIDEIDFPKEYKNSKEGGISFTINHSYVERPLQDSLSITFTLTRNRVVAPLLESKTIEIDLDLNILTNALDEQTTVTIDYPKGKIRELNYFGDKTILVYKISLESAREKMLDFLNETAK